MNSYMETALSYLLGDTDEKITPQSCVEMQLARLCGDDIVPPTPSSRIEHLLERLNEEKTILPKLDESQIIKKTITNNGVVDIYDVSEIPHDVTVRISSEKTDFSRMTIKQYGKNLANINDPNNISGYLDINGAVIDESSTEFKITDFIPIRCVNYLTISGTGVSTMQLQSICFYDENKTFIKGNQIKNISPRVIAVLDEARYFRVSYRTDDVEFMVETGRAQTAYHPYVEHAYTPNEEGIINGIKSISPTMYIKSDDAVDITVEYCASFGVNNLMRKYQHGGTRGDYKMAFTGTGWTRDTFNPVYDMNPTIAYGMFWYNTIGGDLAELLESKGVTLDISNSTNSTYAFAYTNFTRYGVLSFLKATSLSYTFANCPKLKTIDNIILKSDGTNTFGSTFTGDTELENVTITGVIGSNIDFGDCKLLTVASLLSILTALTKDSTKAKSKTLTLPTAVKTKLEYDTKCSEQLALAVDAGWTISYITRS